MKILTDLIGSISKTVYIRSNRLKYLEVLELMRSPRPPLNQFNIDDYNLGLADALSRSSISSISGQTNCFPIPGGRLYFKTVFGKNKRPLGNVVLMEHLTTVGGKLICHQDISLPSGAYVKLPKLRQGLKDLPSMRHKFVYACLSYDTHGNMPGHQMIKIATEMEFSMCDFELNLN